MEPEFIIADEPISALDVSIQSQVVNLMLKLQKERGITFLFIAHDLSMVKYISDRIAVMHFGKIVELGSADEIYYHPLHDYTKSLLSAIPQPDPDSERTRKRVAYQEDESKNSERKLQEIRADHYVFVTDEEAAQLKQEHQTQKRLNAGKEDEFTMKSLKYIATLLIVVLVLSACSNNKSLYSDDGQVFRKVITQDISTLDTALITDAVSGDIAGQAFEGLYSIDKGDKVTLGVAKEMPKKVTGQNFNN